MKKIKKALELLHEADAVLNAGDKGLAAILMRDALSALEGSKSKELTDEEIEQWWRNTHRTMGHMPRTDFEVVAILRWFAGSFQPKEQGAEPVPSALIHERSKPSLMVGFSEEEVRLIADEVAEDCGVDDETEDGAYTWNCMLECAMKVHEAHTANTRAVSIDKIMDEVMGWCCATKDAEEDLRERLMKMAALP